MNTRTRIRFTIFAIVLVAVLGASAAFATTALADVKPIIRLTVVNTSQFDFYLNMYGENYGNEYTMNVPAYTQSKIFIKPDEYSYYMEACNYSKFGEMDLWTFQTLHVPVCGGKAAGYTHKAHHIDVSQIFKPVKVKIRNHTGQAVGLYLRTQDDHHFLNLEQGEHLEVILRKEAGIDYVYSFLACGNQLITGYYTPRVTPPLDLVCP